MVPIQPTLPGLDFEFDPSQGTRLRQAVERTLLAYHDAGLLTPMHAATAELCLSLADAVDRAGHRASAAAMASAQLMAALDRLPRAEDASEGDKLSELLDALEAAEKSSTTAAAKRRR